jgi:steroid 5-alpha reductase family enzyme
MAVSMLVFYFIQRRTKNAGIVDFVWAAGVGSLAVFYAAVAPGDMARRILLALLAGTWGLRLAAYLLLNRVLGKPEDGRYQMLAGCGRPTPITDAACCGTQTLSHGVMNIQYRYSLGTQCVHTGGTIPC